MTNNNLIKTTAKNFNLDARGLRETYMAVMASNYEQDLWDIANENEDEIRERYGEYKEVSSVDGQVKQGYKTLYHIQNMNICSDGHPYDMFLFSESEPTKEELEKAFREDYEASDEEVEEFLTSSEVYAVYAEEL